MQMSILERTRYNLQTNPTDISMEASKLRSRDGIIAQGDEEIAKKTTHRTNSWKLHLTIL